MSGNVEELKECKRAADLLATAVQTNIEISQFNENQSRSAAAALNAWEKRRMEREREQRDWDNRRDQIRSEKLNEDREAGCGGCGTNQNCDQAHGSGWNWNRTSRCGVWDAQCKFICRRSDELATREANDQTRNELGDRKGNFNEAKPENMRGDFYHKDLMPTNTVINCCANIANVTGDVSNFAQKCQQEVDQKLSTATNSNTKTLSPDTITRPISSLKPKKNPSIDTSVYYIGGGGVLSFSMLSLCFCILLLMIMAS